MRPRCRRPLSCACSCIAAAATHSSCWGQAHTAGAWMSTPAVTWYLTAAGSRDPAAATCAASGRAGSCVRCAVHATLGTCSDTAAAAAAACGCPAPLLPAPPSPCRCGQVRASSRTAPSDTTTCISLAPCSAGAPAPGPAAAAAAVAAAGALLWCCPLAQDSVNAPTAPDSCSGCSLLVPVLVGVGGAGVSCTPANDTLACTACSTCTFAQLVPTGS